MRSHVLIVLLCLAAFAPALYADEIFLTNGDKLTGKIVHLIDEKLIFKSDLVGTVTVNMSDIQTFNSDAPIKVHLSDGTVINQKILNSKPGQFAIADSETLKAQEFALPTIVSINPPQKPKEKWSGDITAGLTSTHGNTRTDTQNISVNLKRRTEKDRSMFSGDYIKGRQEDPDTGDKKTTEDSWRGKVKYDYFFSKKIYGYLDGRYEKDSIANLDRRVMVGSGGGYQWVETPDLNFSTEAGLASLYEKFDNQTESNSEISGQAGYYLDKKLTKAFKFIHDLTYYPSLGDPADYYLTSTAELRASVTDRMFTSFKIILDYDATPARNTDKTDLKYIFGLGWSF